MEETKKLIGYLRGFGERKRGKKDDGSEWVLYEYKIDIGGKEKTFTGFLNEVELLGEEVEIEYKQVTKDGGGHYNNLLSMEKAGETKKAVDDANKKYNVVPVGSTSTSENPMFWGMIFNQTCDWIRQERKLSLQGLLRDIDGKLKPCKRYSFDENFDKLFNHLWEKALAKEKKK